MENNRSADMSAIIEKVSKNPSLYVGNANLKLVRHFLDGYANAICNSAWLNEWPRWVEKKHEIPSSPSFGWVDILRMNATSDIYAIRQLPTLYQEFMNER